MSRSFKIKCDGCGREDTVDPTILPTARLDEIPWCQPVPRRRPLPALHPTKPGKVTR